MGLLPSPRCHTHHTYHISKHTHESALWLGLQTPAGPHIPALSSCGSCSASFCPASIPQVPLLRLTPTQAHWGNTLLLFFFLVPLIWTPTTLCCLVIYELTNPFPQLPGRKEALGFSADRRALLLPQPPLPGPGQDSSCRAVWLIGDHSFKVHHGQETPDSGEEKARKMRDGQNFPAEQVFRPAPSWPLSLGEVGTSPRPQ